MNQENLSLNTPDSKKIRLIIRVAVLLGVVTLVEFAIAFILEAGLLKNILFILLTFVKAFYIVGEFMHLSHEKKFLIWSVVGPMIFLVVLIVLLFYESSVYPT
ncbi:MAG: cytochrome C oxidase subunit IV family protein [Cytophagales bacterium]|nr:cytochrome C oxidase subunit IV family protein [Cytophagales bacterium]